MSNSNMNVIETLEKILKHLEEEQTKSEEQSKNEESVETATQATETQAKGERHEYDISDNDVVIEEEHMITVGHCGTGKVDISYSAGQNEYQVAAALLTAAALILPTRHPIEDELCDNLFDLAKMYYAVGEDDDDE